jgi:hypothetical protein
MTKSPKYINIKEKNNACMTYKVFQLIYMFKFIAHLLN